MSTLEYSNQSPQHSAIIERLSEEHSLSDPKAGLVQKAAAKEGFSELAQAEVARAEWCRWSGIGIVQSGSLIRIIRYHQCITPRVVLPLSQPRFSEAGFLNSHTCLLAKRSKVSRPFECKNHIR